MREGECVVIWQLAKDSRAVIRVVTASMSTEVFGEILPCPLRVLVCMIELLNCRYCNDEYFTHPSFLAVLTFLHV